MSTHTIVPLTGDALGEHLDALAALRIEVFARYPYLYDGDLAYEAWYLEEFAAAPGAVIVGAFDGARLVGAATGAPMASQKEAFRAPLAAHGLGGAEAFYFGESVLLGDWRGRGIGHAFFDHREAHARSVGATHATFAAVVRPEEHPARPEGYRPLDPFWRRRGYAPVPGAVFGFPWKEHGQDGEVDHPMQFWARAL